jgi:hypothetical protein
MPMGIGPGLSVTRGGSVTGIGAIGADLALWFDENQAYKSSGGGIVTPDSILTYAAPSPKMIYGSDGVLGYAPHNLFLNSNVPVTQNVTLITGFSYTVTVTGSGSLAGSSGASGTASDGSPATFVATGTTGTFTLTGSLTTIQINRAPAQSGYIPTTTAAVYSLPRDYNPTTGAALGVLVEEARTNLCLYSDDFTNAAWVKVNVTAAKTATGPDGVTNSASTLTSTLANGTVLQTIISASAARITSMFVKRRTGSGTVEVTQNNGVLWTAVTVTANWTRVSVPSATILNPIVGVRIVTSGDAIDVALFDHEVGAFITSPIPTVASQVTRAADQVSILTSAFPYSATAGTIAYELTADAAGAAYVLASLDDGTASNRMDSRASTTRHLDVVTLGVTQAQIDAGTISANVATKLATAYQVNDFSACINGGTVATDTVGTVPTVTTFRIGRNYDGAGQFVGRIKRLAYYASRKTDAELQVLST